MWVVRRRSALAFMSGTLPGLAFPRPASERRRIDAAGRELGHELRRPEADYLRDDIYELRVRLEEVNYRMLYCFHGRTAAVVSHGIVKQKKVPAKEIDLAIARKRLFEADPKAHSE